MDAEPSPDRRRDLLEALALLSRLYWGPDADLCRLLLGPGRELLSRLDAAPGLASPDLSADLDRFSDPAAMAEELEPLYVSLFVNRPGGVVAPLYHSCYQDQGLLMGPAAGEMARRLGEAGLELDLASAEPPDHLAVELEYLGLILAAAWTEQDRQAQAEARRFAGEFMLPWVREFGARLAAEPRVLVYAPAAGWLASLLEFLSASP